MTDNPTLIAGALIAGAVLLNGYFIRGQEGQHRYQLSAAGTDGRTVWRIDTSKGSISMCGSVLDGASFSQAQAQQDASILKMAQDPSQDARAKVVQQQQNISTLAEPRCTEWAMGEE